MASWFIDDIFIKSICMLFILIMHILLGQSLQTASSKIVGFQIFKLQ